MSSETVSFPDARFSDSLELARACESITATLGVWGEPNLNSGFVPSC